MSWDNNGNGGGEWNNGGGGGEWNGGGAINEFNAPTAGGFDVGQSNGYGDNAGGEDDYNGGGGGGGGACFRCGQEGHMKSECTNEPVAREFTGTCRLCGQEGHRAVDCPSAPPKSCNNCKEEGHSQIECQNPRKISREHIPDMPAEDAWKKIQEAAEDRDIADVKEAAEVYLKSCPDVTYPALEAAFRSQNVGVYLIALEKELAPTYTNMDLQGNLGKTYSISWRFTDKPARPKEKEGWPETPEQNKERLYDAGTPVDCGKPKCSNCNEIGHVQKSCPLDKIENADRAGVKCYNCDEIGHRVRDCPLPRPDKFACRNCKQSGHGSKECPEPRSAEGVECKKCNEIGHFSKDCPTAPQIPCFNCGQIGHRKNECTNERVLICRNCDAEGHVSRDCPKPRDYSRVQCQNCKQMGHTKARCKEPLVEDTNEDGGDAGYAGGDSGNGGYGAGNTGEAGYSGRGDDAAAAVNSGGGGNWESGGGAAGEGGGW